MADPDGDMLRARKARLQIGRFSVPIPASRPLRIGFGVLLILCGFLGFLPVLGFWMAPLGVMVLSIDVGPVRRVRRRTQIWWVRRRRNRLGQPNKPAR